MHRPCIRGYLGLSAGGLEASALGAVFVAAWGAVLVAGALMSELLVPLKSIAFVAGAAAVAGGAGWRSVLPSNCMFFSKSGRRRTSCAFRTQSKSVRTKKMPVVYLVIFVKAVPLPAPKRASVVPPPKAWPMPASFFGN